MLYTKDVRPTVVAENQGLAVKDIARLIGEQWRALSEAEKEVRASTPIQLVHTFQWRYVLIFVVFLLLLSQEYKDRAAAIKAERANEDNHDEEEDENEDEENDEDDA